MEPRKHSVDHAQRIECHFDHEIVIVSVLPKLIPDFTPSCIVASLRLALLHS
jgi:hypothetical protein